MLLLISFYLEKEGGMKQIFINLSEGFQISFNAKILLFFGLAGSMFTQISGRFAEYLFAGQNEKVFFNFIINYYNYFSFFILLLFFSFSVIQAHKAKAREKILVRTNF